MYRVKAMLTVNQCLQAFWLGNLKNRDIKVCFTRLAEKSEFSCLPVGENVIANIELRMKENGAVPSL